MTTLYLHDSHLVTPTTKYSEKVWLMLTSAIHVQLVVDVLKAGLWLLGVVVFCQFLNKVGGKHANLTSSKETQYDH